jgi:fluoride exporter
MLRKLILLALAGAVGTLARFEVGNLIDKAWVWGKLPGKLPNGILTVNILGCFVYGLVTALAENHKVSPQTKFYLLTGFVAAFTTFSTFMFKEHEFLMEDYLRVAGLYIVLGLALGLAAVFVGVRIGRLF